MQVKISYWCLSALLKNKGAMLSLTWAMNTLCKHIDGGATCATYLNSQHHHLCPCINTQLSKLSQPK